MRPMLLHGSIGRARDCLVGVAVNPTKVPKLRSRASSSSAAAAMNRVAALLSLLLDVALGFGSMGRTIAAGESCLSTCHSIQNECFDQGHSEEECLESMSAMTFPFAQAADEDHFDCDVACTGEGHSDDDEEDTPECLQDCTDADTPTTCDQFMEALATGCIADCSDEIKEHYTTTYAPSLPGYPC